MALTVVSCCHWHLKTAKFISTKNVGMDKASLLTVASLHWRLLPYVSISTAESHSIACNFHLWCLTRQLVVHSYRRLGVDALRRCELPRCYCIILSKHDRYSVGTKRCFVPLLLLSHNHSLCSKLLLLFLRLLLPLLLLPSSHSCTFVFPYCRCAYSPASLTVCVSIDLLRVGKNTRNYVQCFLTLVLFTFCTCCILRCLVCVVVSCLVCIVVSCLVCIVVVVRIVVILCVFAVLCVYCCFYFRCRTAGYKSVLGRSCDRPPRHRFFLVSLCL